MTNVARIIASVLLLVAAFFFFMAVSFFIYPYVNPEVRYQSGRFDDASYTNVFANAADPEVVNQLENENADLRIRLENATDQASEQQAQIDSLLAVVNQFERDLRLSNIQLARYEQQAGSETDTLLQKYNAMFRLDEEQLAPIVNRLDDQMLFVLYQIASNRQRQKLLASLEPNKAANILRRNAL